MIRFLFFALLNLIIGTVSAGKNDHFIDRTRIGLLDDIHLVEGTNAGATAEAGEPNHGRFSPKSSVWWSFTSEKDGPCEIEFLTDPAESGGRVNFYTGTSLNDLSALKVKRLTYVLDGEQRTSGFLNLQEGKEYFIAFDQAGGEEPESNHGVGRIRLQLDFSTPANDDFANALDLTGQEDAELSANLARATREPGERSHLGPLAYPDVLSHSVWWTWVASDEDLYSLTNTTGRFVAIYKIFPDGSMREVVSKEWSPAIFQAEHGLRYYFVLLAKELLGPELFQSAYRFEKILFHDHRTLETAIPAGNGVPLRTVIQTPPDEWPRDNDTYRYWTWTVPASGHYEVSVSNGSRGTLKTQIFTGVSENPEDEIPSKTKPDGPEKSVVILEGGQVVTLRTTVPFYSKLDLSILEIAPFAKAPNDHFADASELMTHPARNSPVKTLGATTEIGEPESSASATLWWRWTAPKEGVWRFTTNSQTTLEIFRGTNLTDLEPVEGTSAGIRIGEAGETHFVRASNPLLQEVAIVVSEYRQTRKVFAIELGAVFGVQLSRPRRKRSW